MSHAVTTVRPPPPYNPTKQQLSASSSSNFPTMPFMEASLSSSSNDSSSRDNDANNNNNRRNNPTALPQSPDSRWKEQEQQQETTSHRKNTSSTANLSTDEYSPGTTAAFYAPAQQQQQQQQRHRSNLSAQLLAAEATITTTTAELSPQDDGSNMLLQQQRQQREETKLSMRDMFQVAGDDDDDEAGNDDDDDDQQEQEYFDQALLQQTPRAAEELHSMLWNPTTPPTSLGGGGGGPENGAPRLTVVRVPDAKAATTTKTSQKGKPCRPAAVLYSAIGSLEDPSNQSFQQSKWTNGKSSSHNGGGSSSKNKAAAATAAQDQLLPDFYIPPSNYYDWQPRGNNNKQERQQQQPTRKSGMRELLAAAAGPKATPKVTATTRTTPDDTKPPAKVETAMTTLDSNNMEELNQHTVKASNLRRPGTSKSAEKNTKKSVKIVPQDASHNSAKKKVKRTTPKEQFRPSSDAYTPRMGKKEIKFKPAEKREPVQQMSSGLGTLSRPNFRDALRRVAMILRQHIVKIERRFESHMTTAARRGNNNNSSSSSNNRDGLFMQSMKEAFSDDRFVTPTYKVTMVRVPMARGGMVGGLKMVRKKHEIPSESEIYDFAHRLFKTVQLSSECSIVCLIYIERLMEVAKVPLLADTWKPIVMCGLLLASKVWQDLSSWNIEFTTVYPQYSLDAIHRLELQFLRMVKWDLYISSTLYAKYYFALRALVSKQDFRQRYNRMVGGVDSVQAEEARKIEERSTLVKEEALQLLSRSM